jgi:replicative DNA helicase
MAVSKLAKFGRKLEEVFGYDMFGTFRLSCHPNGSMSVPGIETRLDAWGRAGWKPDIVVIDYADILAPIDTRQDKRHQVDETWKRLRGLSQKRHVCVITASQADAASYKVKTLDKSNFSESKTKLAHVNAFIGINATADERDKQLRRLNFIVRREESYSEQECLYVAGCLAIANPMIVTILPIR